MKVAILFLSVLVAVACSTTQVHEHPSSKLPVFSAGSLTASQQTACAEFRSKRGKDRIQEAEVVRAILPSDEGVMTSKFAVDWTHVHFRMSRAALVDLLGEPDRVSSMRGLELLSYDLGVRSGQGVQFYHLSVILSDGYVISGQITFEEA
jgi:hypothetical protein